MDETMIQEHMEVVGSDGGHVGVVDHVEGDRIKLTRSDADAGGMRHYLPLSAVSGVDGKVMLSMSADDAQMAWEEGD